MSSGISAFRKCLDTLEKGVLKAEKADEAIRQKIVKMEETRSALSDDICRTKSAITGIRQLLGEVS